MKVNNQVITEKEFAYDGCHKLYIIESEEDRKKAQELGYDILPIDRLEETYKNSCSLRLIRNWSLNKVYAKQFVEATFN